MPLWPRLLVLLWPVLLRGEHSGPQWCARYPGSNRLEDLEAGFRSRLEAFLGQLRAAGATVAMHSTHRPDERQYLMHWAWQIGREHYLLKEGRCQGGELAEFRQPPPHPSGQVAIEWHWRSAASAPLHQPIHCEGGCPAHVHWLTEANQAAADMVRGYAMVGAAARHSRHREGRAADLAIAWHGDLQVVDRQGAVVTVAGPPRNGSHPEVIRIGASYGVIKQTGSGVHWSTDGH